MNKAIVVAIAVGVFFTGFGISYAIFSSTYDPATMKFRNQELFDQMISNNPKMTQNWMDSMGSQMTQSKMMSEMSFNVNAPITIPMIGGYFNGEKVYFVHTEVSDAKMADMMSLMINFPTLHVSELKGVPQKDMAKVYVFTNGISGTGPYGGGPFMFQIDVFDSIPDQAGYSQFRVPYLVIWNDNSTPRLLTSVEEILEAEARSELTIQKTDNVVNAPMIVWIDDGTEQKASTIKKIFDSMPGVEGQVMKVDVENYSVTFKLHQSSGMDMMN